MCHCQDSSHSRSKLTKLTAVKKTPWQVHKPAVHTCASLQVRKHACHPDALAWLSVIVWPGLAMGPVQ